MRRKKGALIKQEKGRLFGLQALWKAEISRKAAKKKGAYLPRQNQ